MECNSPPPTFPQGGMALLHRDWELYLPCDVIECRVVVPRPALGPTQLPTQCVSGALSFGLRRPGRKAEHSPPSSAEFKNA